MSVKRRVVWMSDEDWVWMRDRAAAEGMTVSAFIRAATAVQGPIDEASKALFGPDDHRLGPASLRSVPGFNSRPFRPVPKK